MSADEEELRRRLEEQLKNIRVEDVLVQTAVTLVNLAARCLDEGDRDQSKLAIDSVRALMPLCPDEVQTALRDPLAQLQMAWAKPAGGTDGASAEPAPEPPRQPPKPESRLWTPGQP